MKIENVLILIVVLSISACSSSRPRTKWTDKTMRIMIDPTNLEAKDYVRIQAALVSSGKWVVVDRSSAYKAIKKEQERLHRASSDRFEDKEKWAHWGKLYGVGGVVIGHIQCALRNNKWAGNRLYNFCTQFLSIVDSNTGEVIVAIEEEESAPHGSRPDWNDAVEKLNEAYPEEYMANKESRRIIEYKEISKEEAIRQSEKR